MTTSSEMAVALRSSRTRTTVPSRMSRTIGSSASERAFHASQSLFTLRQTRLTVSLPTAPLSTAVSARRTRHRDLHPAECSQQRPRSVAVAVTGGADRSLRIIPGRLRTAGVARSRQRRVELAFEHGLQEFVNSIAKPSFYRVEPVVEKVRRRLDFRLRQARSRA